MKNLYLIPTDKPSRLWVNNLRRRLELDEFPEQHPNQIAKHIYITNSEEIKEGWYFNNAVGVNKCVFVEDKDIKGLKNLYGNKPRHLEKIILTTDRDLIKDGVQPIDDTFLEWFVKNPSCEEVEVVDDLKYFNIDELRERHLKGLPHLYFEKIGYKIIIPKEEPKQERSYSEEEVITLLESLVEHPTKPGYKRKDILKVIEQFKKK